MNYYLGVLLGAFVMMFQTDWFGKLLFLAFLQCLVLTFILFDVEDNK